MFQIGKRLARIYLSGFCELRLPKNTRYIAKVLYLSTQAISNARKVLPSHMERTSLCHGGPDKARTDRARWARLTSAPTDRLRWHGLRPYTGGAPDPARQIIALQPQAATARLGFLMEEPAAEARRN